LSVNIINIIISNGPTFTTSPSCDKVNYRAGVLHAKLKIKIKWNIVGQIFQFIFNRDYNAYWTTKCGLAQNWQNEPKLMTFYPKLSQVIITSTITAANSSLLLHILLL